MFRKPNIIDWIMASIVLIFIVLFLYGFIILYIKYDIMFKISFMTFLLFSVVEIVLYVWVRKRNRH